MYMSISYEFILFLESSEKPLFTEALFGGSLRLCLVVKYCKNNSKKVLQKRKYSKTAIIYPIGIEHRGLDITEYFSVSTILRTCSVQRCYKSWLVVS